MTDFSTALKVLVEQYSYHNAFLIITKTWSFKLRFIIFIRNDERASRVKH